MVEADPAGGDIRAGYGRGALPPAPGLLELATAARRELTADDVLEHSLALDGDGRLRLVAGVTGPAQLATVTPALPAIAAALRETGRTTTPHDVLVDVGRLDATTVPWALLPGCDLVVLVARPTLRQVRQLRTQLGTLREHLDHDGPQPGLGLLLVGEPSPTPQARSPRRSACRCSPSWPTTRPRRGCCPTGRRPTGASRAARCCARPGRPPSRCARPRHRSQPLPGLMPERPVVQRSLA